MAKTAITKWEDKFSKYAQEAEATTGAPMGNFIGLQKGVITVGGAKVPDNKMPFISVGHIFENAYYVGKFDAKNPVPPVCFAFGIKEEDMKPHAESTKPQNKDCKTCKWNQFASADTGKGKACKNMRRVAMIPVSSLKTGTIAATEVQYVKTPPTSSKFWDKFVHDCAAIPRPPFAVKGIMSTEDSENDQFHVLFEMQEGGLISDDKSLDALETKYIETMKMIDFPYKPLVAGVGKPKTADRKFAAGSKRR